MREDRNGVIEVLTAIAETEGKAISELDFFLADHVDPELIDRVILSDDCSTTLSFEIPGHDVTITGDGEIFVDGTLYRPDKTEPIGGLTLPHQDPLEMSQFLRLQILDHLPGMVYRCKNQPEWPIEYASKGCQTLTGYDRSALMSGSVSPGIDLVHPSDRDDVRDTVQHALEDRKPYRHSFRLQTKDSGQKRVFESGRGVFQDDEVDALVGVIIEITGLSDETALSTSA